MSVSFPKKKHANPKKKRAKVRPVSTQRLPEVLDVTLAASMLMVSADTVYDLFASGTLPARKVGRKWITTKAAILRWIENTSANHSMDRALRRGDTETLVKALNTGAARVRPRS